MKWSLSTRIILWILCCLSVAYIPTTAARKSQSAALLSGNDAYLGEYTWHVRLKRNAADLLLCGGSLLSSSWVLTAAQCIKRETSIFMVFGTIMIDDGLINMTSTTLFTHPLFNPTSYENDIGLIELPTVLTFNLFIKPIDLISEADAAKHDFFSDICFICGFGCYRDDSPEPSPRLLWGIEQVVRNDVCARIYNRPLADTQICTIAFPNYNQRPCSGDSGGALVWKDEKKIPKQIGIFTFGNVRRLSAYPSGYTRVSSFLNYIYNITNLNKP